MEKSNEKSPDELMEKYEALLGSKGGSIQRMPASEVEAAVWGWPWFPFRECSEEEGRALIQQQLRNRLMQVGDNSWCRTDREMSPHLAEGHMLAVQKAGGIRAILQIFLPYFPSLNPFEPNWQDVSKELMSRHVVAAESLSDFSLIDVVRYLNTAGAKKLKVAKKKRTYRRSQKERSITKAEREVWTLKQQGHSVVEIARQRKCTTSAVYERLRLAEEKIESASSRTHRSAKAMTNVEGLNERNLDKTR